MRTNYTFDNPGILMSDNESDGIAEEYEIATKLFPDYSFVKQEFLMGDNNVLLDKLVYKKGDIVEELYFDISNIFGKF